MKINHRIIQDPTGFGRRRLTCDCGASLVCQPYMSELDWTVKQKEFMAGHTSATINQKKEEIGFREIMKDISNVLKNADGDMVAEIYNKVCDDKVKYLVDSVWIKTHRVKEHWEE